MNKDKIKKFFDKLFIIFLYMQPFLDVIAAYNLNNNINNYTSIIRLFFLVIASMYILFSKYENKKKIVIYFLATSIFMFISSLGYINNNFLLEIKDKISTFYYLYMLLFFIAYFTNNNFNKKHLLYILTIYLLFIFIPNLFHFGFSSYIHSKMGESGLFYSSNAVGALVIILVSFLINEIKDLKIIYFIPFIIIFIYSIFSLGTKTPVLGLFIILGFNILIYLFNLYKKDKKKGLFWLFICLLLFIISLFIISKTIFFKNIMIHLNYIMRSNMKFGSFEFFDNLIFSERLTFLKLIGKDFASSNILGKLFGIGYTTTKLRLVEIDYIDVLFREGIIGFIIYFLPIVYILKNIKIEETNFKKLNIYLTIIIIFLIGLFQGHIFIETQSSIYISLIFAFYYINYKKGDKIRKEVVL